MSMKLQTSRIFVSSSNVPLWQESCDVTGVVTAASVDISPAAAGQPLLWRELWWCHPPVHLLTTSWPPPVARLQAPVSGLVWARLERISPVSVARCCCGCLGAARRLLATLLQTVIITRALQLWHRYIIRDIHNILRKSLLVPSLLTKLLLI